MRIPLLLAFAATACAQDFPPPKWLGDLDKTGPNIQRTMRLLAESTPEKRNTVRILFYGQSITEQGWWKIVADDLKARFPHANLVIANRAIGGHASQLLVKTAEADLYPWQPDLLIFHVYGSHDKYEDILRRVRERTCAEILQQNDHVTKPADLTEETDPEKLWFNKGGWDAFMNHRWLPELSRKYSTEWCDQRAVWKRYLADYALEPKALLKDSVHLNKHGEYLMAEAVKAHLRYDAKLGVSPAEQWVKTLVVGKDIAVKDGTLTVEFEGNRVDAILGSQQIGSWTIDGKPVAELAGAIAFTRTTAYPQSSWPCLLRVGSQAALVPEAWILTLANTAAADVKDITFELSGTTTGADGAGKVGERFVSKSGRVVIEPDDWNLAFCVKVHGPKLKDGFKVHWVAGPQAGSDWRLDQKEVFGVEAALTLAQGLANGKHTLQVKGDPASVRALRIYTPPLQAGAASR